MRKLLRALGVCIIIGSSFFVMAAIGDLVAGDGKTSLGVLLGLLAFFGGTGYGGLMLYRANRRVITLDEATPELEREQRILSFAESRDGRVTVPEVAAHCHLSIGDTKAELQRMALQGVAELHLTDDGISVFTFPGFMSSTEKAAAKDPFLS